MRKFLLAITLFATCQVASALDLSCLWNNCTFAGLYVGGGGGVATNMASFTAEASSNFMTSDGSDLLSQSTTANIYGAQPWGELFIGWGARGNDRFYLGARGGVNFSSYSLSFNGPSSELTAGDESFQALFTEHTRGTGRSVEWTIDFKPGVVWCQKTMLFALIGVAFNEMRFTGTSNFTYVATDGNTPFPSRIQKRDCKGTTALRGGLGIEQMLSPCVSFYASFVYTYYRKASLDGFADVETPFEVTINGHHARFRGKMRRQVTSLGLAYYF